MSFVSFVSSVALSLRNALGIPQAKIPIDGIAFVSYVLPPLACGFIAAMLVVMPRTRMLRLALWPLVASLALRAGLSVDMSRGKTEQTSLNFTFAILLFYVTSRTLDWALAEKPLVRHHPANSSLSIIMDALDLVANARGLGWDWSRGLYVPRETRPANRTAFVFYAFISAVGHALAYGAIHGALMALIPVGVGPMPGGSTIFDGTLPFPMRYLRASIISTMMGFEVYASVQVSYDMYTILGILVFGQDPAQWPPAFNAPWCATSLSDFWGRRWHQWLRRTFLVLGGYPLSIVLGRSGIVVGAFLASALLHHVGLLGLNGQIEIWWMLGGFGMMGPGVLAERAFCQLTGKRVGGVVGWVWTMSWLLVWGNVMVEGFASAGMFGSAEFTDSSRPWGLAMERLAVEFDAWLHTT